MKIAYLVSQYPAVSHTFILAEVRLLRALGFDVRVTSINASDRSVESLSSEEKEEVSQTYYVKDVGFFKALWFFCKTLLTRPGMCLRGLYRCLSLGRWDLKKQGKLFFYFIEAAVVGQWMKRQGCSYLHVHFANAASTVGLLVAKIFPVSFSMTVHGPDVFDDVSNNNLREKIEAAKFVCCISKYAQSQLMRLVSSDYWKKLEVCHLGVDPSIFLPQQRKNNGPIEILCVGRLVPAKGQRVLIRAIEALVQEHRDIKLRLIGDGPDFQSLRHEAAHLEDIVIFEGALNHEQVKEFYSKADIFVLPSFAEGVPVVLMEAMAMGIPCVSTFIAGIPELIRNEIEGLLVFPSDEKMLTEAIATLIDEPDLRKRLGKAARARIKEKFDLNTNVRKLAEVYRVRLS